MGTVNFQDLFPVLSDADIKKQDMKFSISKEIYLKRKQMGMTQSEFADYMGVSQGMVSKWESFDYNFTIDSIVDVFDKLGIDVGLRINTKQWEVEIRKPNTWRHKGATHSIVASDREGAVA